MTGLCGTVGRGYFVVVILRTTIQSTWFKSCSLPNCGLKQARTQDNTQHKGLKMWHQPWDLLHTMFKISDTKTAVPPCSWLLKSTVTDFGFVFFHLAGSHWFPFTLWKSTCRLLWLACCGNSSQWPFMSAFILVKVLLLLLSNLVATRDADCFEKSALHYQAANVV